MKADPVQIFMWALILVAILTLVFRDQFWLRVVCVLASLLCVFTASMRVTVSSRMAIGKLQNEGKSYGEATFADGSRYSTSAAQTSIPLFFTAAAVLATLAIVPPKTQSRPK